MRACVCEDVSLSFLSFVVGILCVHASLLRRMSELQSYSYCVMNLHRQSVTPEDGAFRCPATLNEARLSLRCDEPLYASRVVIAIYLFHCLL